MLVRANRIGGQRDLMITPETIEESIQRHEEDLSAEFDVGANATELDSLELSLIHI